MDRRHFLKSGTVAASSLILPFPFHTNQEIIKLAVLGTGWWRTDVLLRNAMASGHFDIVALCDIDSAALDRNTGRLTNILSCPSRMYGTQRSYLANPPGIYSRYTGSFGEPQ